jgi:hypothetical protein
MDVVYGSTVNPFSGRDEAEKGRLTIFQPYIPELEDRVPEGETLHCIIFGPHALLLDLTTKVISLNFDTEYPDALRIEGNSGVALEAIKKVFLNIVELNADDRDTLEMLTA